MAELELIHEHYLKRELLRIQIDHEIEKLNDFKAIGKLGPPFVDKSSSNDPNDPFPVLHHLFSTCIKTFPFVDKVDDQKFWADIVQEFLEDFAYKEISGSADRDEETKRYRMARRFTKLIHLHASAGIKTTRDESEAKVPRVSERGMEEASVDVPEKFSNGYHINVVGVRQIIKRGFLNVSERTHSEFIVQTEPDSEGPSVYVARRYSDFKDLDKKLRKEFPGKQIPTCPSKNKSDTVMTDDEVSDDEEVLVRERQRTSFRGYLRLLLEIPAVSRSQTFLEFLFRDKIRALTPEEQNDMKQREKMDKRRATHQVKFFEIASARARLLEGYIQEFREELLAKDGIHRLFAEIRERETIEELSPKFKKFVEWANIELAATLYHIFVADDTSPEFYSQIKRIHGMLPYSVMKTILRYSNPVAMIKGVSDLFLAQPFGQRSLLQNILYMVLKDDIKGQERLLDELRALIAHPDVTRVIDAYVANANADTKATIREIADEEDHDVVFEIFQCGSMYNEPVHEAMVALVGKYHREYRAQVDKTNHDAECADRYVQLREYLKLAIRKRDKDKMQEFWSDEITIKFIREMVTVFYTPLIRVFKSANMHESVGDFERFMNDLCKVVDRAELDAASADPNQLVESFIALCSRHQGSLYKFVHLVYKNDKEGLFAALIEWISNIIDFLRDGNGKLMDLHGLFESAENIDKPVVISEMNGIIDWIKERREWRDTQAAKLKQQQKQHNQPNQDSVSKQDDWSQAMPNGGISGADFGLDDDELEDFQEEYDLEGLEPPKRPSVLETAKLRPLFEKELCNVLV